MSTSTYILLSGDLPGGLELSSTGTIFGTPISVLNTTTTRFVIRKTTVDIIEDTTYSITIEGSDPPIWVTDSGYLEVGQDNEEYIFNNQYLYYQLEAVPNNAPIDTEILFYIGDDDGALPPGLTLSKDGLISGYVSDNLDLEYDGTTPIEYPKVYEFTVTATDTVHQSKRDFKIVVTSPNVLNYNDISMPLDIVLPTLPPGEIYVAAPQWIMSSDLGTYRASNNHTIFIQAHDAYPQDGTLTYILIDSIDEYQTLPQGLNFDPITGYIYGYLPHIPALERTYEITIDAVKTVASTTKISRNIFTLTVTGEVEKTIEWITDSDLGTIKAGSVSELFVQAQSFNNQNQIRYSLIGGELPEGLTFNQDGSLSGTVGYANTLTSYTFMVNAKDVYELSEITREFSLEITDLGGTEFTKIYIRPFLEKSKRRNYVDFVTNESIFDYKSIYRYFDSNFGIQNEIKIVLEFGIEKLDLKDYVSALRENFYRRDLYFGSIKKAIAKKDDQVIYELIYADVVDPMITPDNRSVSRIVYRGYDDIYYPSSITNMKNQLRLIPTADNTYIDVDDDLQPRFMKTRQTALEDFLGYIRVIPICYALPGQGDKIISRIRLSQFDFKLYHFEIDRIIIENTQDHSSAKYLLLERQSINDPIATDDQLFGSDYDADTLTVRLDDEDGNPLARKN